MSKLDLLENLQINDSIRVQLEPKNWQEALEFCFIPLIEKKVVDKKYVEAIFNNIVSNGPYFIISDYVALPHAQSDQGVYGSGFSLITLKNEIYFEKDERPIKILIGLASNSPEIHTSVALPQIVAVFEDEKNIKQIKEAKTKEEVLEILQNVNLKKYL
ncbi:MAG: PTS sugar transporter subunit IIA [Malacoplasma sp.]|nr:PTS sugar transporter subunit IIA [Malacoplasma sp.]